MKLPNFFIVGAAKSGTTSIYEYLNQHPEIYMSPIKEPNYFAQDLETLEVKRDYNSNVLKLDLDDYLNGPIDKKIHYAYVTQWEQYLKLFKNARDKKAVGEASISYLYSKSAAKSIKHRVPNAKIIIILRNPVERAFSHYLMALDIGYLKDTSFYAAIKNEKYANNQWWGNLYVDLGMYFEQVKRYLEVFQEDNMRIYLFDDLKIDPQKLLKDMFEFLQVNSEYIPDISKNYRKARIPRFRRFNHFAHQTRLKYWAKYLLPDTVKGPIKDIIYREKNIPTITSEELAYLKMIYENDIEELAALIGHDLSGWL